MGVACQSLLFLMVALLVTAHGNIFSSYIKPSTTNEPSPLSIFKRDTGTSEVRYSQPVGLSSLSFSKQCPDGQYRYANRCRPIRSTTETPKATPASTDDSSLHGLGIANFGQLTFSCPEDKLKIKLGNKFKCVPIIKPKNK